MDTDPAGAIAGASSKGSSPVPHVIPSLNGIRAISVMIVVVAHAGFEQIVPGGLGVTIFFFLSGYLITTLLLSEYDQNGAIDIPGFYARRFFRIAPPLLLMLAIAYGLVCLGVVGPIHFNVYSLIAQIFYFANYDYIFFHGNGTTPPGTGILWSLAVEEHFYIFYPFLLIFVLKSRAWPTKLFALLVTTCIAVLIWRIYLVEGGASETRTYYASDTRIDSIAYGCLLALVPWMIPISQSVRRMSRAEWCVFAAAVLGLLSTLIYRAPVFRETFRYSIQGLCLLPIFYHAVRFHDNFLFKHLNSNWIVRIGVYSYFIYLIHSVVIAAVATSAPPVFSKPLLMLIVAFTVSVVYAAMVDRYVDTYFRHLRKVWRPRAHGNRHAGVTAARARVAN